MAESLGYRLLIIESAGQSQTSAGRPPPASRIYLRHSPTPRTSRRGQQNLALELAGAMSSPLAVWISGLSYSFCTCTLGHEAHVRRYKDINSNMMSHLPLYLRIPFLINTAWSPRHALRIACRVHVYPPPGASTDRSPPYRSLRLYPPLRLTDRPRSDTPGNCLRVSSAPILLLHQPLYRR